MNASPMTAVREAIATILEADPQLMVTRVFNEDMFMGGKAICYPYVAAITYDSNDEGFGATGLGRAEINIFCNAVCAQDPAKAGIKTATASDIVSRVKYRLETFDVSTLPVASDGRYSTRVLGIVVDGNVGDFDDGSGKIRMGITATVLFGQTYTS